jgi:hypothetical protein
MISGVITTFAYLHGLDVVDLAKNLRAIQSVGPACGANAPCKPHRTAPEQQAACPSGPNAVPLI